MLVKGNADLSAPHYSCIQHYCNGLTAPRLELFELRCRVRMLRIGRLVIQISQSGEVWRTRAWAIAPLQQPFFILVVDFAAASFVSSNLLRSSFRLRS